MNQQQDTLLFAREAFRRASERHLRLLRGASRGRRFSDAEVKQASDEFEECLERLDCGIKALVEGAA